MATTEYPQITFRIIDESMIEAINDRTSSLYSSNTVSRRDLGRYYLLLGRNTPKLTKAQAHLMLDIHNGVRFDPIEASLQFIWAALEDAEDQYFEKWGVDRTELIERIRGLDDLQRMALIDAIERFWSGVRCSREEGDDTLAPTPESVGLVAVDVGGDGRAG